MDEYPEMNEYPEMEEFFDEQEDIAIESYQYDLLPEMFDPQLCRNVMNWYTPPKEGL